MTQAAFRFNCAIVRTPSRSVTRGLRAHDRGDPSYAGVLAEHRAYVAALRDAGVKVTVLPALEAFPDSIFVEDPAIVFADAAILLRPGAPTRVQESAELKPVLRELFHAVLELPGSGHADGGDVLTTAQRVMIGLSKRTNEDGARDLKACLEKIGRKSELVATPEGVLHLKSACSLLDDETILSTARLAHSGIFKKFRQLIVPEGEEPAANALRVNDILMVGADYPRTLAMLDQAGFKVLPLRTTEIAKIDAGLSCMSLRWQTQ
jgi:dimethylargininase